jgi:hypothetical protein
MVVRFENGQQTTMVHLPFRNGETETVRAVSFDRQCRGVFAPVIKYLGHGNSFHIMSINTLTANLGGMIQSTPWNYKEKICPFLAVEIPDFCLELEKAPIKNAG